MNWFSGPSNLSAIDYAVLAVSTAVLFGIGFFSGRKEENTNDFFLGGRRIPVWAATLSFVATEISAVTIIAVPATAFRENWEYLQFFIGSFAARIFIAFIFIPAFYKFNCTTIYEYLRHRFGPATQYAATCFFFITRLLASGVRLTVAALAVSLLIGWHIIPTIVLFSFVAIVYISWGGIKAVIWTNVWQTLSFVAAGVGTIWFLAGAVDGGLVGIFETAKAAGRLDVFDWGADLSGAAFVRSIIANPNIWWLAILNGFFGSVAAYGTDHELMQRLLTVETRQKSQRTTLLTPLVGFVVMSLYLVIGSGLFAYYAQNPGAALPDKMDEIFPHFANFAMPGFLRGLVLSAVVMASIDSPLNSLTASFVTDIYRPLVARNRSERHYLIISRCMVGVFGVLLAILAYLFSFLSGFLWWAFKIGGVTFGSLLGVFLLGLLTKRTSNRANIIGMVLFAVVNLALLILTEQGVLSVGWTWLVLIGTFGTFGFGWLFGPVMEKRERAS